MNLGTKLVAIVMPIVFAAAIMTVYLMIRLLSVDSTSKLEKVFWLLSAMFLLTILTAGFWGLINL